MAEREYVEDTAAKGKLPRFVDIVDLTEAQFTELLHDVVDLAVLVLFQGEGTGIKVLLRDDHLSNGLRIGDNEKSTPTPSQREGCLIISVLSQTLS